MAKFVRDFVTLRRHYHLSKFQTLWRDRKKYENDGRRAFRHFFFARRFYAFFHLDLIETNFVGGVLKIILIV